NGELVEIPKISNFCTYKLILSQKERNCILTVDLEIKTNLNIYLCKFISEGIVKCAENIGISNFDDDYEIELQRKEGFYHFKYIYNVRNEKNNSFHEIITYTGSWQPSTECHSSEVVSRVWRYWLGKQNKLESISQFRKGLGIKGDKIKTTMFKFKFHLCFGDRTNNKKHV
ncbi:hypothetical protein TCON_2859, partial [Astathelohania contejeani]